MEVTAAGDPTVHQTATTADDECLCTRLPLTIAAGDTISAYAYVTPPPAATAWALSGLERSPEGLLVTVRAVRHGSADPAVGRWTQLPGVGWCRQVHVLDPSTAAVGLGAPDGAGSGCAATTDGPLDDDGSATLTVVVADPGVQRLDVAVDDVLVATDVPVTGTAAPSRVLRSRWRRSSCGPSPLARSPPPGTPTSRAMTRTTSGCPGVAPRLSERPWPRSSAPGGRSMPSGVGESAPVADETRPSDLSGAEADTAVAEAQRWDRRVAVVPG